MTQLTKEASVTRASLYKSLAEDENLRFDTVVKVVKALGCRFSVMNNTPLASESVEAVETIADDRATVCC